VATTKITGEEEIWSGTDLWDIQANIDGARKSLDVLRPVVAESDPELLATLDERFDAVQALLDAQGSLEDGFAYYPELTDAQVLELSRAIDALAEPLALLTAAAVL
jgi:iron uptake system component EfeO